MNLSRCTDDQLADLMEPLTERLHRLADIYELGSFEGQTEDEVDAEIREVGQEMRPIWEEIARRFPQDQDLQQIIRDIRLYQSRFR